MNELNQGKSSPKSISMSISTFTKSENLVNTDHHLINLGNGSNDSMSNNLPFASTVVTGSYTPNSSL